MSFFLDLFCGAGGFSCGLTQAGWKPALAIDSCKYATQTYAANHPHTRVCNYSIQDMDAQEWDSFYGIPLVVGGPPCQGFSTLGKNNPDDARNSLIFEYLRVIERVQPTYLVMENVRGILSNRNQPKLQGFLTQLNLLGYYCTTHIVNAASAGVPQSRSRVIILGSKLGTTYLPTFKHPTVTVKEAFEDSSYLFNHDLDKAQITNPFTKAQLHHIPSGGYVRYQHQEVEYLPPSLYFKVDWSTQPGKRFREERLKRLDWHTTAPTITTNRTRLYHPSEDRYLTVREGAILQSFPDTYRFLGSMTQQWKQVGNAVPPLLAKLIGRFLINLG